MYMRARVCVPMCVYICSSVCVCLGAAGGQTTWHPDVEQDVLAGNKAIVSYQPAQQRFVRRRDSNITPPPPAVVFQ